MSVPWVFLTFLSINLYSVATLFDKFFCAKKFKSVLSYATLGALTQLIFITLTSFFINFSNLSGWPLFFTLFSGPAYFLMWLLYLKAIATVEISRSTAIFNVSVIFNAILGVFFLGEEINGLKWLAIVLIFVGATICSYGGNNHQEKFNPTYLLVVLSAFIGAIGNLFSKIASAKITPLVIYAISFYASLPFYFLFLAKREIYSEIKDTFKNKKVFMVIFFRWFLGFLASCLFYLALVRGPISLIGAVNGIGPMLVFLFSTFLTFFFPKIIKEKISQEVLLLKFLAIILIVGGVVMINL